MSSRVLVVDDNRTVVELIKALLQRESRERSLEFFTAYNGEQALEIIYQVKPDIIFLDIDMPRIDGYKVLEHVRCDTRISDIPIILLSCCMDAEAEIKGIELGTDYCLPLPCQGKVLGALLHAFLRRKEAQWKALDEKRLCYAGIEINVDKREAYRDHESLFLSPKEFDLLAFFLRHPRQVLIREMIIEHVWGYDYEGETMNVVDVYVGYLRKKMEQYGPRLIQTVRGVGYVLKLVKKGN